jgi:hypothetical protein
MPYTGAEIIGWFNLIPEESRPKIQLESRYRRERFGEYLVKNCLMRYTHRGKYTFDLINEGIGKITKQGLAGAAAGFADNLNAQREADRRRAEDRTKQKEARIRMLKEKKYYRLKALEAEQKAMEEELEEKEEKEKQKEKEQGIGGSLFGSSSKSGLFGGGSSSSGGTSTGSSLKNMFGWGNKK